MKFLIGTGGWAYFKIPGMNSLLAYAKAFEYVEVNSTFYEYPSLKIVENWRNRVPKKFEFTIRCHQDLTHKYKLEPVEESYKCIDKMIAICKILKANILHLQTPPKLEINDAKIESIKNLLNSINLGQIRLAWEIRTPTILPEELIQLMQDYNIIHAVDLSKEEPAFESNILYTRLFGKGYHNLYQFDDEELRELERKALKSIAEKAYFAFHGAKMYKDAARLLVYRQTGNFPKVTKAEGLNSLKEVLSQDTKFPCTKKELIKQQGWKVIDTSAEKRVHASKLLEKLPERIYHDIESIIQPLKQLGIE